MAAAAAEAAAAAASHAHHVDPSLSHASVEDHNPIQHSHHPPRISPVDSAKDPRPPSRKERHSPDGNYMYRPNFPHPPPRHDMSATFPPGVDHHPPRMNMNYRGNSYYPPRAPRAPYRPPHSTNGPHINASPIDDPLEVFNRLLREKRPRESERSWQATASPFSIVHEILL
uniref:Uncharacterized protein n=1 Tax=Lygus hesperus TaxID=30085 RepID=A0A0K8SH12_LYGHE